MLPRAFPSKARVFAISKRGLQQRGTLMGLVGFFQEGSDKRCSAPSPVKKGDRDRQMRSAAGETLMSSWGDLKEGCDTRCRGPSPVKKGGRHKQTQSAAG